MSDVTSLEEKIKRLKKTLFEQREKSSGKIETQESKLYRKRLKRLQRKRRVLVDWIQQRTKVKEGGDSQAPNRSGSSPDKKADSA